MTRFLAALIFLLAGFAAASAQQPVTVIGPVTPGHLSGFFSQTQLKDSGTSVAPSTGLVLYASPTGVDTNNSCAAVGTPCTLKGACAYYSQVATFVSSASGGVTIHLADGSYSAVDGRGNLCSIVGDGGGSAQTLVFLVGDCVTPANVILNVPNNDTGVQIKDFASSETECFTINLGTNALGFSESQWSIHDALSVVWGTSPTGSAHYNIGDGAILNIDNETITANFSTHVAVGQSAILNGNTASTTCTVSPTIGDAFLIVNSANVNADGWAFSGCGSATGLQAILQGAGFMLTGGTACGSFFPGNGGCDIDYGFQDDARDNPGNPTPVGGVSCPSGVTATSVTVVKGVVTHC